MKYELPFTEDVKPLGEPFLKPCAFGKPRVFFLNSVRFGREIAELAGRMDLAVTNITYDRNWDMNKWGFGDFYDARCAIWDFHIVNENLEEALCSDTVFDVMVIPSANGWGEFTEKTRLAVLKRVEEGAGLLLIAPFDGASHQPTPELSVLSPLKALFEEGFSPKGYPEIAFDRMKSSKWEALQHPITSGIPMELLPWEEMAYYPYEAKDGAEVFLRGEDGSPIGAVWNVCKGRVAALCYYPRDILPQNKGFDGHDGCFNPITDLWHGVGRPDVLKPLEIACRLAARAILWCGGFLDRPGITDCRTEEMTLKVQTAPGAEGTIFATIENAYGDIVAEKLAANEQGQIPLPGVLRLGGDFTVFLSLEASKGFSDFYAKKLSVPLVAEITSLRLDAQTLRNGDTLTGSVETAGEGAGVLLRLTDGYGRVLAEKSYETIGKDSREFSFVILDCLSLEVWVEALLLIDGFPVFKKQSAHVVVTPSNRSLTDFEVFLNPQNRGWRDLQPHINRLFPQIGMTGNFIGDNRVVAMSGGKGLGIYWYDRSPYVENKERYLETKDKQYLRRKPCLNDEAFWAENRKNIRKNVLENKKYGPIAYFAQDEGSLTCYTDELDLCFCPDCMKKLREWLRGEYGTVEALNDSWGTVYSSFEEAEPMTLLEARAAGNFASWGDHRTFMELTYADGYRHFSEMIRESDPEGRVRMSGCQASTAYSGNNYELLHRYVRYFEAYPVGNQYEFHRSFRKEGTILGGWFGYGAQGMTVQHNIWYALFHGLTLISIFWEYACLNPDFSFSQSALSMGKAFKEIRREGIGKLLLYAAQTDTLGVAVHYSMSSVHGTTALGRRTEFEKNRQGWLDVLEDLGYQYRFLSSSQIEDGELASGVQLLILPYSLALSEGEAQQIENFVAAGGMVVGDYQTGLMDGHLKKLTKGMLDRLFGIRRLTLDAEYFYTCDGMTTNPEFPYFNGDIRHTPGKEELGPGVQIAEMGTRADKGTAAYLDGFMEKAAAVVVHPVGKGKAVYLNFSAKDYPEQRCRDGGGDGIRGILTKVFSMMEVQKPFTLTGADSGIESFYYRLDGQTIAALQKGMKEEDALNYDGLTIQKNAGREPETQHYEMELKAPCHLYDIRKKAYLGWIDRLSDSLSEGDCALYAMLTYRAKGLSLKAPLRVSPGERAEIKAELILSEGMASRCVFALQVVNPAGDYAPLYSKNLIVPKLSMETEIPFAFNDPLGIWRIEVKDVLTGVSAQAEILLKG